MADQDRPEQIRTEHASSQASWTKAQPSKQSQLSQLTATLDRANSYTGAKANRGSWAEQSPQIHRSHSKNLRQLGGANRYTRSQARVGKP